VETEVYDRRHLRERVSAKRQEERQECDGRSSECDFMCRIEGERREKHDEERK
jgi:hypothetical protein